MAVVAKITAEEFGKLPKEVQEHYSEKEGVYFLDVTAKDGLELADTGNLKKTLQKERSRADAAEKAVKVFDGIDPEKARDALTKLDEIANWDPDKKLENHKKLFEDQVKAKYEGDLKKTEARHKSEMDLLAKKHGMTRKQLEQVMLQEASLRAISNAKGKAKLLLPTVRQQLRLVEDEKAEKFRVEVIDSEGNARLSTKAGSYDQSMTIEELIEELRADTEFQSAFDGSGSSGSGASSDNKGTSSFASVGGTLFISAADAKDPSKYRAARDQAEKVGKQLEIKQ